MKKTTIILFLATLAMVALYAGYEISLFKTLAITSATAFYHFAIRLLIGIFFERKYGNNISWEKRWFKVGENELRIYEIIKVKSWKKHIPTYNSSSFDVKTRTYEQIAMAMCQAELVHETIIVFSFVPIIASMWFGAMEVFIVTSVISAFIDLLFVILQRYNRPRILKIIKLTSKAFPS